MPHREVTHLDLLEAHLRWALEAYVRPALDEPRTTQRSVTEHYRRELARLAQADALLTEGGAWESTRRPG